MSRPIITCNEDLRQLSRRRLPRAIFDYIDRGSYDELTLRANRADLDAIRVRQRVMIDVDHRSLATTLVGEAASMPVAIAPIGLNGLMHGRGEIFGARAAQAARVPFTLSTMSIVPIEDVRAAVDKPFWFQLYVFRDRGFARSLLERAIAVNCSALVLTADLQIQGQRHRDIKNGLSVPPRITPRNVFDMLSRPSWMFNVLLSPYKTFGNLAGFAPTRGSGLTTLAQWIATQFDPTLRWDDVAWVRSLWPGKLVIKGILDTEDARLAAASGADAIVVSNHGGRQLDSAPSSIAALPAIVDAVGGEVEIMVDGGIRSGQDVFKALALGARGVMIGKAFVYGLSALKQDGANKALELIRNELNVTMALTGIRDVGEIGREVLWHG